MYYDIEQLDNNYKPAPGRSFPEKFIVAVDPTLTKGGESADAEVTGKALKDILETKVDDHSRLLNRDEPDQHPISAITDLSEIISNLQTDKMNVINPTGNGTFSFGDGSIGGTKGFSIAGYANGKFILDTVEGLTVGDEFVAYMSDGIDYDTNYEDLTITEINDNEITFAGGISWGDRILSFGYIWVKGKPDIGNIALGSNAFASGYVALAQGFASTAEGNSNALGKYSHAEGRGNTTQGYAAHSEGRDNNSVGKYSHTEGRETITRGECSHAEGRETITDGMYSHAEGYLSVASEAASHAEGSRTSAAAAAAHAEGSRTQAQGSASHAEGFGSITETDNAHAEGLNCKASGNASHAEGVRNIASGIASHSEGADTSAVGRASHAEGDHTIATGAAQHVAGRYNVADSNALRITGNGTSESARSNAERLDANGNLHLAGDLQLEGNAYINWNTESEEGDLLATESWVNTNLSLKEDTSNKQTIITEYSTDIQYPSSKAVYDFVNSSVENIAAYYITSNEESEPFESYELLQDAFDNYPGTFYCNGEERVPTKNDYLIVLEDETHRDQFGKPTTTRYIFTESLPEEQEEQRWEITDYIAFQYIINNTGFTSAQLATINSGVTSSDKQKLDGIESGAEVNVNSDWNSDSGDSEILNKPPISKSDNEWHFTDVASPSQNSDVANKLYVDSQITNYHDNSKLDKQSPVGTGSFSLNRKADTTTGENSVAVNYNTTASGQYSFASGESTTASGRASHAEGYTTEASSTVAHAEGSRTKATAPAAHAEGGQTTASASSSHAEGFGSKAETDNAHAEGLNTVASGNAAHAEGVRSNASGIAAHAEGADTIASTRGSHAEGDSCVASGQSSHAEGNKTIASGNNSHAEGLYTIAAGTNSHSAGRYTRAKRASQFVFGASNVEDPEGSSEGVVGKFIEIVGNGPTESEPTTSQRSNARALDWDGNQYLKGDIYVGCDANSNDGIKIPRKAAISMPKKVLNLTGPTGLGTYPRMITWPGDGLRYVFLNDRYKIVKPDGSFVTVSNSDIRYFAKRAFETDASQGINITEIANAFPCMINNHLVVFFRAQGKKTTDGVESSYYSIRAKSSFTGTDGYQQFDSDQRSTIIWSTDEPDTVSVWEPWIVGEPLTGNTISHLVFSLIRPDQSQDIVHLPFSVDLDGAITRLSAEVEVLIDGSRQLNMDGVVNPKARPGTASFAQFGNGDFIGVIESSVNNNASNSRPLCVQYFYSTDDFSLTSENLTLFLPAAGGSYGTPSVAKLPDDRIIIMFMSSEGYGGIQNSSTTFNRIERVFISKIPITSFMPLTEDLFTELYFFDFAKSQYGRYGSVYSDETKLYALFTYGYNTSTSASSRYGNLMLEIM